MTQPFPLVFTKHKYSICPYKLSANMHRSFICGGPKNGNKTNRHQQVNVLNCDYTQTVQYY